MCHVALEASGFPGNASWGWPACSTRPASARSSPRSWACPWTTPMRSCSAAMATRWCRCRATPRSPACRSPSCSARSGSRPCANGRPTGRRGGRPAQDGLGLLRAGGVDLRDGRRDPARPEAGAALRRPAQGRVPDDRPVRWACPRSSARMASSGSWRSSSCRPSRPRSTTPRLPSANSWTSWRRSDALAGRRSARPPDWSRAPVRHRIPGRGSPPPERCASNHPTASLSAGRQLACRQRFGTLNRPCRSPSSS